MERRISVDTVGKEEEPVVVIENFHRDPDCLRVFAEESNFADAGRHYPGLAAPLPNDYLHQQGGLLAAIANRVFGISDALRVLEARFSVVTTLPEKLSLEQRLPHVDAFDADQLALVHYLVPQHTGGTAFYRHRSTGYETVGPERASAYLSALNGDLRRMGAPPSCYPAGDTNMFQRIAVYDGIYNRALIYRGRLLHSGSIVESPINGETAAIGRLTVTGFFKCSDR